MIENISFKGLPSNCKYVNENLIVGARQGLKGLKKLVREEGVDLVIDVRSNRRLISKFEEAICKILHLKRVSIPTSLGKEKSSIDTFEKAADLILDNKNGKTFIHCRHGKHRSVMVAAIAQIKAGKIKTAGDLTEFLKEYNYFQINKQGFFSKIFSSKKRQKKINNLRKMKDLFASIFIVH